MRNNFLKTYWYVWPGMFLLFFLINGTAISAYASSVGGHLSMGGPLPASNPDFSKFTRSWISHSAILNFSGNGQASFVGRTYTWCGLGVASPCDTIDAGGHIQSGYQEQIQFLRVSGDVAYGTITSSNFQPVGTAVTASLQSGDTLLYTGSTRVVLLCGPTASVGKCGA